MSNAAREKLLEIYNTLDEARQLDALAAFAALLEECDEAIA